MKIGDTCYIIANNSYAVPVTIINISQNIYTVKFIDKKAAIRLPKHRLFETEEEVLKELNPNYKDEIVIRKGYRAPNRH
jgi:hypothetical protein